MVIRWPKNILDDGDGNLCDGSEDVTRFEHLLFRLRRLTDRALSCAAQAADGC